VEEDQVKKEREATYAPAKRDKGVQWKNLNVSITKIMQEYCGEEKSDDLLTRGLKALNDLWKEDGMNIFARNPHELMRALEVLNIMTNAEIVIHSSIARKASSKQLHFMRSDCKKLDPPEWHKFVIVSKNSEGVHVSELPIDYYSPMDKNYEKYNQEYIKENST
jgi:succinate dehydrogenase/fumarate reductase flavoprotein subunit